LDNDEDLKRDEACSANEYLLDSGFGLFSNKKRLAAQHLLFYFLFEKRWAQISAMRQGLNSVGLVDFMATNPDQVTEIFPDKQVPLTWQGVLQHVKYVGEVPSTTQDWFEQFLRDLENDAHGTYIAHVTCGHL
jgi:hypothetical protein